MLLLLRNIASIRVVLASLNQTDQTPFHTEVRALRDLMDKRQSDLLILVLVALIACIIRLLLPSFLPSNSTQYFSIDYKRVRECIGGFEPCNLPALYVHLFHWIPLRFHHYVYILADLLTGLNIYLIHREMQSAQLNRRISRSDSSTFLEEEPKFLNPNQVSVSLDSCLLFAM